MKNRTNQIGFSQRVRLEWLEHTASLVLAGSDKHSINDSLQELLKDKVSVGGTAKRGNREKIITILMKIWVTVSPVLEPLRIDGLNLLKNPSQSNHIAVHWGMIMAAYPFWGAVAEHVGRLLRLQGSAAAAHVQRRLREQYGERETVSRAARRVLRSFVDWGVLEEGKTKGVYRKGLTRAIDDPMLIAWLVEAALYSYTTRSRHLRDIVQHASLFPFSPAQVSGQKLISLSPRLELFRSGMDDDLIMVREQK